MSILKMSKIAAEFFKKNFTVTKYFTDFQFGCIRKKNYVFFKSLS